MPETLTQVTELISFLQASGLTRFTLLVVPGLSWTGQQIDLLKRWQDQGLVLAGHGWHHRCRAKRSLGHRLHGFCLSRDVAEHLSSTEEQIKRLIRDSYRWFVDSGFREPELYVPPAWAMGSISAQTLQQLPYRWYEVLTGVHDVSDGRFHRLPLLGYEADTSLRVLGLRFSNALNRGLSTLLRRTIRISIHPYDVTRPLADSLRVALKRHHPVSYHEALDRTGTRS
jgi:predicted deacetylase